MSEQKPHFYEFGPFRLDPSKRRLLRDGEVLRLTPKAFDLLLVLVEESGRTVEKDELLERVWAGTIVEENNLNQNITTLRKLLGDSRQESQYIATIPGLGYRFVAEVRKVEESSPKLGVRGLGTALEVPSSDTKAPTSRRTPGRTFKRALQYSVFAIVPLSLIGRVYALYTKAKPDPTPVNASSIMVLPLENLSGDPEQEYFADGMTDALIGDLAKIGGLHVISRTSSMHYK